MINIVQKAVVTIKIIQLYYFYFLQTSERTIKIMYFIKLVLMLREYATWINYSRYRNKARTIYVETFYVFIL